MARQLSQEDNKDMANNNNNNRPPRPPSSSSNTNNNNSALRSFWDGGLLANTLTCSQTLLAKSEKIRR
jgi:hypothetical protein